MNPDYIISHNDVGKCFLRINGKTRDLSSSIGYVQSRDVGMALYVIGGFVYMESTGQHIARTGKRPR